MRVSKTLNQAQKKIHCTIIEMTAEQEKWTELLK